MNLSFKIAASLFALIFVISAIVLFFVYNSMVEIKVEALSERLLMTARLTALLIDGDLHEQIPLQRDGMESDAYRKIQNSLRRIRDENPLIKYIYTIAERSQGKLCFVVDAETNKDMFSFPGDIYDTSKLGKTFDEFLEAEVQSDMLTDKWGSFISGYAPVFNSRGERVALLGVDMLSNVIAEAKHVIRLSFLYIFVMSLFLSLLLGAVIAARITRPVKRLVDGTRRIAGGDLQYQVSVKTHDEIGELANSFNDMARSLRKSYDDLKFGFISTIRTLMAALEAKDPYTRGHSERVAEYCRLIAEEMELPEDEVRSLENIALMHDIGKIGIREAILNKPDYLDEDEREIIKEHAAIGEDIVKPLAVIHPTLLRLVRSHHERHDGKGYPDGLKGDQIPLEVSILAVADGYDAMTTDRPYRKGLSQDVALAELRKHAGTQFNRDVVLAFDAALKKKAKDEK